MMHNVLSFIKIWRDFIYLVVGITTCITFIAFTSKSSQKQEDAILYQERRIESIEMRESKRDSILNTLSTNQQKIASFVDALRERQNDWEVEHIKLMKLHNLWPNKLYRGEIK